MLSVTAHTLRQKARLAISLAWVGGFIDAIGFILLAGVFTSNMTGNTASLGQRAAEGLLAWHNAWPLAARACFTLLMFLAGALLSGLITVGGQRRGLKSIYALALSVEMLLLAAFMLLALQRTADQPPAFSYPLTALAALAMGLQNATITQIAGAVVRTTHVTGVLTDFGLESVQLLFYLRDKTRGRLRQRLAKAFALSYKHTSFQRLFLLLSIWATFLAGAILGVLAYRTLGPLALLAPVGFLAFLVTLDFLRPIADVARIDHRPHHHDHELKKFGIDPGILPPTVGAYRIRGGGLRKRRAPDLGKTFEMLSRDFNVVLLLLGDDLEFDENNLTGLVNALRVVRSQRTTELVLCVTRRETYERLVIHELADEMGRPNLCPDPEFAVARAVELASSATPASTATELVGKLTRTQPY